MTLQKLGAGYNVTREELRALAELENTLENPVETQKTNSPEREALRAVVASISESLPRETQAYLARSLNDLSKDT